MRTLSKQISKLMHKFYACITERTWEKTCIWWCVSIVLNTRLLIVLEVVGLTRLYLIIKYVLFSFLKNMNIWFDVLMYDWQNKRAIEK